MKVATLIPVHDHRSVGGGWVGVTPHSSLLPPWDAIVSFWRKLPLGLVHVSLFLPGSMAEVGTLPDQL